MEFISEEHAPETTDEFWSAFNRSAATNRELIASLKEQGSGPSMAKVIETIKENMVVMQKYATSAASILPPYDIRRSQEIIETLNKDIKELEKSLVPKKKFSFSSRKATAGAPTTKAGDNTRTSISSTTPTEQPTAGAISVPNDNSSSVEHIPAGCFAVLNKKDETRHLSKESLRENSLENQNVQLLFRNCQGCKYYITSLLGSVRIENATDCCIYLGPCCTSVYLENAQRCTLYIACHQLRIHKSNNCSLYVKVNGHPIIEDCGNMGFAPYAYSFSGIDTDMQAAGLDTAHCWDNVVDFRWHRTTQSPNWHLIQEKDRLEHCRYPDHCVKAVCLRPQNNTQANTVDLIASSVAEAEKEDEEDEI